MTGLKTLTIRIADDNEREALRYVMRESGIPFASQAVMFACKAYREQCERRKADVEDFRRHMARRVREQQQAQAIRISQLQDENRRLRAALRQIRQALDGLDGDNSPQT